MDRQWMTADPIEYNLLKAKARANRNHMTEAESAFWSLSKGNSFGQRCIRQHIIGDYIVDFLFRKSKLIVEIDGGYHLETERPSKSLCLGKILEPSLENQTVYSNQVEEDRIRQEWLEQMGYKVIRFTNDEVLYECEKVIKQIQSNL